MPANSLVDNIPLWILLIATVAIVLLSVEGGYRLGVYRHRRSDQEKETPVGEMVAATLGLLAFLLAFTFGFAASRYQDRQLVVLEEANAIGTAWLRAGLLPDLEKVASRKLLCEYVATRVDGVESGQLESTISRSEEIQLELWQYAENAARIQDSMVKTGLYIQSLNDVIDRHADRVMLGIEHRIPLVIWLVLFGETILAMSAMGYHGGLTGSTRSLASLAIAFAFSGVIILIADLDNPASGLIRTGQQPLVDVQRMMGDG
ncbi:MAG: hypothetical protein C0478_16705 [Planctomyces sp.]|nr:hypothetical protein [Planctomyces sp.]